MSKRFAGTLLDAHVIADGRDVTGACSLEDHRALGRRGLAQQRQTLIGVARQDDLVEDFVVQLAVAAAGDAHAVQGRADPEAVRRGEVDAEERSEGHTLVEPAVSTRTRRLQDEEVIQAADEYGMAMGFNGIRLFHH